jgi:hypothetical protein
MMPLHLPERTTLTLHVLPLLLAVSAIMLAPRLIAPARALDMSLYQDAELRAQSDCVKRCLINNQFAPAIYSQVGCAEGQARDCLCHDQRRPAASRYLSRCFTADIKSWNCIDADLTSALSIFNRYCAFEPATAQAGTAAGAGAAATTAVATATATATATVSAAGGSSTPAAATGSGGTLAPNTRLPPTPSTPSSSASSAAAATTASGSAKLSVTGELFLFLAVFTTGAHLLSFWPILAHALA